MHTCRLVYVGINAGVLNKIIRKLKLKRVADAVVKVTAWPYHALKDRETIPQKLFFGGVLAFGLSCGWEIYTHVCVRARARACVCVCACTR